MTCAFDSLAQSLLVLIFDYETIAALLEVLANEFTFLKFVFNIYKNNHIGIATYEERCKLIKPIRPVQNQITWLANSQVFSINSFSNAAGNVPFLLQNYLSILEEKSPCTRCHIQYEQRHSSFSIASPILINESFENIIQNFDSIIKNVSQCGLKINGSDNGCQGYKHCKVISTG